MHLGLARLNKQVPPTYKHTFYTFQRDMQTQLFPNSLDLARGHPEPPMGPRTLVSYGTWFEACQSQVNVLK